MICGILIIFCENYACVRTLSRGVFILLLISESRGGVHRCKCFVATLHSAVLESSLRSVSQSKFYQGSFSSPGSSRNHVVGTVG